MNDKMNSMTIERLIYDEVYFSIDHNTLDNGVEICWSNGFVNMDEFGDIIEIIDDRIISDIIEELING